LKVKEALKRESSSMIGQENDPEYNLILSCNTLIQQIDEEIASTHRYVVNIYSKKFPELENLIPNIMDYIRTVQRIGNELDMTLVEFSDILPSASVMVVSVSGSTTSGLILITASLITSSTWTCRRRFG
jgi:U4/U6 small nuclear ribonucleoprotein PRP31